MSRNFFLKIGVVIAFFFATLSPVDAATGKLISFSPEEVNAVLSQEQEVTLYLQQEVGSNLGELVLGFKNIEIISFDEADGLLGLNKHINESTATLDIANLESDIKVGDELAVVKFKITSLSDAELFVDKSSTIGPKTLGENHRILKILNPTVDIPVTGEIETSSNNVLVFWGIVGLVSALVIALAGFAWVKLKKA